MKEMKNINKKASASISLDAHLLEELRADAKSENKNLSEYIQSLLYKLGYRPYNAETAKACIEMKNGIIGGIVDTSSKEAMEKSLFIEY